jgi:hypothetical protein
MRSKAAFIVVLIYWKNGYDERLDDYLRTKRYISEIHMSFEASSS